MVLMIELTGSAGKLLNLAPDNGIEPGLVPGSDLLLIDDGRGKQLFIYWAAGLGVTDWWWWYWNCGYYIELIVSDGGMIIELLMTIRKKL